MANTAAQIRENERKKLQKMFDNKHKNLIEELQNEKTLHIKTMNEANRILKANAVLREENEELKQKVAQYEDWINRLQEFMDADDSGKAFKEYVEKMKTDKQISDNMKSLMGVYSRFFNMMF